MADSITACSTAHAQRLLLLRLSLLSSDDVSLSLSLPELLLLLLLEPLLLLLLSPELLLPLPPLLLLPPPAALRAASSAARRSAIMRGICDGRTKSTHNEHEV